MRNRGDVVAAMLRLSLRNRHSGDRVLPARYDDNYVWLLPGETRHITVSWPSGTRSPRIVLEGYNVAATKS